MVVTKKIDFLNDSGISDHSLNRSVSDVPYIEKRLKSEFRNIEKLKAQLMGYIPKVGDIDSINKFKTEYLSIYRKDGWINRTDEFDDFEEKWTFLHEAAKFGNVDIARFLVFEMKQDPNMISESLWTPLQLSCSIGNDTFTKMLLEDPRIDVEIITDFDRGSAVQIAWKKVPKKASGEILSNDYVNTSHNGYLECVKAIYRVKNYSGETRCSISTSASAHKRSSSFEELKNLIDIAEESKDNIDNYSIDIKLLQMSKSTTFIFK